MPPVVAAVGAAVVTVGGMLTAGALALGASVGISAGAVFAGISVFQQIAASIALTAIQKMMMRPASGAATRGVKVKVEIGEDAPASIILGRYATAGDLVYAGSYGWDGDTPNAYYALVTELSDFPATLRRVMVNGEWVHLSASDEPGDHKRGKGVIEYRRKGAEHLTVKFYDGSQTVADPGLVAAFGDAGVRPWTSDMIGLGLTYGIVTARLHPDIHRGVPEVLWELDGMPLYDPRRDGTRPGGAGPHRLDDRATWGGSGDANPIVMVYNLLLGITDPVTGEWLWGGRDITQRNLPEANWFAAMNACDAAAPGAEGVEPMYRAGIEIRFDGEADLAAIIEELLKTCHAEIAECAGIYTVTVGAPGASVYAFGDDDIIITSPEDFDPFPGLSDVYNGVTATYPEPEDGWAVKDAPRRFSAAFLAADGGRRQVASLGFPLVPYRAQVQRLMKSALLDQRRFRRHVLVLPPEARALGPLDVVSWTSQRNGYIDKQFAIELLEDLPNGCVSVSLREVDPSDYNFTSQDILPSTVGFTRRPPVQSFSNDFTLETATVRDAEGENRRSALRLNWNPHARLATGVRYRMRVKNLPSHVPSEGGVDFSDEDLTEDGVEVFPGELLEVFAGEAAVLDFSAAVARGTTLITTGIVGGVTYQVQARYKRDGKDGPWSGWMEATAPVVLLGLTDLDTELNDRLTAAEDAAAASAAESADALALAQSAKEDVATLAGDTIADLEALLDSLGGIDAGDITAVRTLALAALERGWNADPTFQIFAGASPEKWTTSGLGSYGAPFVGRYGGGYAIDIPAGAYAATVRSASDVAGQMVGADAEAGYAVLYGMVTLTSGNPAALYLRGEWKASGSAVWTRGDMRGLTAPEGTFAQLGITARPGTRQGFELLVKRPAVGAGAAAVSVVLGKLSSIATAVDLDVHLLGMRPASEAEIAAGLSASRASVDAVTTTVTGLTSALAALDLSLGAQISGVSANLATNYLTASATNAAISAVSTSLNASIGALSANLSTNYYTRVSTDGAISSAIAGFASALSVAGVAGLSAALSDAAALRIDAEAVLAGRIQSLEARRDPTNIASNGDFGLGSPVSAHTGWVEWPATFTVVARGGSGARASCPTPYMLQIAQSAAEMTGANETVPAKAGEFFSGAFFYATAGTVRDVSLQVFLRALDVNGDTLERFALPLVANATGLTWARVEGHALGPLPANTATLRAEIRRYAGGAGTGFVTGVSFIKEDSGARAAISEVSAVALGANAAITSLTALIAADFGSSAAFVDQTSSAVARIDGAAATWVLRQKAGAAVGTAEAVAFDDPSGAALSVFKLDYDFIDLDGKVSARDLVVFDSTNKVPDDQLQSRRSWGLSAATVEWQLIPVTTLANAACLGELRYVGTGATGSAIITGLPFPVNTGPVPGAVETLACSYRVRGDGGAYRAYAQIVFYDQAGELIPGVPSIGAPASPTTVSSTQMRSGLVTVPATAVTARWRFVVERSGMVSAFARFFAPVVRRQAGAVEIGDGQITAPKLSITDMADIADGTIGNCTITKTLNFAPGVVVTGAIGANAVSDIGASVRDTVLTIGSDDTWTTVCSYTVGNLVAGTQVLLSTVLDLARTSTWASQWSDISGLDITAIHEYRLLRGSTVVHSGLRDIFVDAAMTAAGSRTYALQMRTSEPAPETKTFIDAGGDPYTRVMTPASRRRAAQVGYAHLVVQAFKR